MLTRSPVHWSAMRRGTVSHWRRWIPRHLPPYPPTSPRRCGAYCRWPVPSRLATEPAVPPPPASQRSVCFSLSACATILPACVNKSAGLAAPTHTGRSPRRLGLEIFQNGRLYGHRAFRRPARVAPDLLPVLTSVAATFVP